MAKFLGDLDAGIRVAGIMLEKHDHLFIIQRDGDMELETLLRRSRAFDGEDALVRLKINNISFSENSVNGEQYRIRIFVGYNHFGRRHVVKFLT